MERRFMNMTESKLWKQDLWEGLKERYNERFHGKIHIIMAAIFYLTQA